MPATAKDRSIRSPYEALALTRFNADPYRDLAQEGGHRVDFTVHVAGDLLVAAPVEQLFVTQTDLYVLLTVALDRLAPRSLDRFLRDAASKGPETKPVRDAIRRALEATKPKTACRGRINANLTFQRVK